MININNELFWQVAVPVLIGFAFHKLWELWRRNRGSQNTPPNLSLKFWLKDNWISIGIHLGMWYLVITQTKPILDFVTQFKHTPKEIKDILESAPIKGVYIILGWMTAYPLTKIERKARELKKKIPIIKNRH